MFCSYSFSNSIFIISDANYELNSNAINSLTNVAKNLNTLILYSPEPNVNTFLRKVTQVKVLEIDCINGDFDKMLNFSSMKNLEILSLHAPYLEFNGEKPFLFCLKLKALKLSYNEVILSKDIFEELKKCESLQNCDFSHWKNLNALVDFVQHSKIQHLSINDCCQISENDLKFLFTECPSLIYLEYATNLDDNMYETLSSILSRECPSNYHIKKLNLEENKIQESCSDG